MTAYLLESSLALFKKCCLLFFNYCVFARVEIENRNILLLPSRLFLSSSMKESPKIIFSWNFPALVTCKTSKFVTKETSLLLPQTPWHLLKSPINFINQWGDSLTNVGCNFGLVKISTFNTFRWNAPQLCDSITLCIKFDLVLLLTPTLATELERTLRWLDVTTWELD